MVVMVTSGDYGCGNQWGLWLICYSETQFHPKFSVDKSVVLANALSLPLLVVGHGCTQCHLVAVAVLTDLSFCVSCYSSVLGFGDIDFLYHQLVLARQGGAFLVVWGSEFSVFFPSRARSVKSHCKGGVDLYMSSAK